MCSSEPQPNAFASMAEASVAKPQTARGIVHYARQQGTQRA
jgi:hypothetical protein